MLSDVILKLYYSMWTKNTDIKIQLDLFDVKQDDLFSLVRWCLTSFQRSVSGHQSSVF